MHKGSILQLRQTSKLVNRASFSRMGPAFHHVLQMRSPYTEVLINQI